METFIILIKKLRWLLLGLVILGVGVGVLSPLPPRAVTIEAGSQAGSWYQNAQRLATYLEAHGISVTIRSNENTMENVNHVNDPGTGVDVSFIVQPVERKNLPDVTTLGSIAYQPLFGFYRRELGVLQSPAQLLGRRIALPAENSASARLALPLLRAFGVTPDNTHITYYNFGGVTDALTSDADAAFILNEASSPIIREMVARADLRSIDFLQSTAIERSFPALHAVMLPRASFDLARDIPAADLHLIAATTEVVVRKNLHPAIVFLLMQAMTEGFSERGLVNQLDEFPAPRGRQLPINLNAEDYYRSGVPWQYRLLPMGVASVVSFYTVLIGSLVVLLPIYNWLNLPSPGALYDTGRRYFWLRTLLSIERQMDAHQDLTDSQLRVIVLINSALAVAEADKACNEALNRIKARLRDMQVRPGLTEISEQSVTQVTEV
jgi:TRAP-type uncharacterized transport system substrate-binding protein